MTQLERARNGKPSPEMRYVARTENISLRLLCDSIARGETVILKNKKSRVRPCGVGGGLRVKINANIGTSTDRADEAFELKKLRAAVDSGTDTVMDLSTGGDIKRIRRLILKESDVPVGTVPIYEAAIRACRERGHISRMRIDDILGIFEEQAMDGVDFFTVHCGITRDTLMRIRNKKRVIEVVSRGGALLAEWMIVNKRENPLYEAFDDIMKIAKKYDITLSLGDALRPGSVVDSTDRPQIQELVILGELAQKAREGGIQVMIEGPGHIPINHIQANVQLEKSLCRNAPFYVLGPLVTDIAPGYDHISGAIGGALAAYYGADFLCYVTPAEHLRIPGLEDIREGVMASRIAAHAADIARGKASAIEKDRKMSLFRASRNWKSQIKESIDPARAKAYRDSAMPSEEDVCTMCSEYCSIKIIKRYFK